MNNLPGIAVKHQIQDTCWVCGVRFTDANPPGTANREDHHIIPRAYGGIDGPQVSLCDHCHTRVHKIQACLLHNKPYFIYTQGLDQNGIQKVLYLATCAYNAKKATDNDPNKKLTLVLSLNGERLQKIEKLKQIMPSGMRSRASIYNYALDYLYSKMFVKE